MKENRKPIQSPHELVIESEGPWNRLTINLNHIIANYRILKANFPSGSFFYSVVKSDAYGHGIEQIAHTLSQAGCRHFAVESPEEGIKIRNEKIPGEILLLNPIPEWMSELSLRYDLSVSVIHPSILQPLEDAAAKMNKTCKIHLNLNTGLNRLGIAPSKLLKIAKEAVMKPHLRLTGLFAQPQGPDRALSEYSVLKENHGKLLSHNIKPRHLHFANSTVFLSHPETISDGARIGILLYGVYPPEQYREHNMPLPLKPAMGLTTELVQIRQLKKGSSIGYRSRQKTERDTVIGTIPIGYAQGINRKIVKNGFALMRGRKAGFIGNVSMNAATIDITEIADAKIGDTVTLLGKENNHEININELADWSGTIGAELMMLFGRGISRNYILKNPAFSKKTRIRHKKSPEITIYYNKTLTDLPHWIDFADIVAFLKDHMVPYDDPEETIISALDYAFSSHSQGGGFVLLALHNKKIIGASVCVRMDKVEFVPANLLTYLCVHREYRKRGLGSKLFNQVIQYSEGDIKLHLDTSNPALKLCEKLGFRPRYLEMRLEKKRGPK